MTKKKLLQWFTLEARKKNYPVNGGRNGGGWIRLALACGCTVRTKGEARFALEKKLGLPPLAPRFGGPTKVKKNFAASDAFLESYEWRRVRMVVLKRDGARCACCGATPADGVRMNVDHIKPRKKFPELALDPQNLQVLCEVCNHGKGNWDQTDWRAGEPANDSQEQQHLRSIMEGTWAKRIGGQS
jgi:hypothetical protein